MQIHIRIDYDYCQYEQSLEKKLMHDWKSEIQTVFF